jgi:hypothetical protein
VVSSRVVALGGQIGAEAPPQIGVVRLGVLLAHGDARGVMDDGVLADMLVFAAAEALQRAATTVPEPQWLSGQMLDTGRNTGPRCTRPPG